MALVRNRSFNSAFLFLPVPEGEQWFCPHRLQSHPAGKAEEAERPCCKSVFCRRNSAEDKGGEGFQCCWDTGFRQSSIWRRDCINNRSRAHYQRSSNRSTVCTDSTTAGVLSILVSLTLLVVCYYILLYYCVFQDDPATDGDLAFQLSSQSSTSHSQLTVDLPVNILQVQNTPIVLFIWILLWWPIDIN